MKEYIEREALLNSFEELMNIACEQGSPRIGKAMRTGTCAGIAFCRNEVRHAPAANVAEVRHAKWVSSEQYNGRPECPVCFYVTDEKTNYCPHCGCKMDKEE